LIKKYLSASIHVNLINMNHFFVMYIFTELIIIMKFLAEKYYLADDILFNKLRIYLKNYLDKCDNSSIM
jgi:hypothetical protein